MDFLKKAKAQLEEAQADLTKAAASMGLGDKKDLTPASFSAAEPPSSNSTPINTPATSVAPSIAEAPKAKLPLAIRKNCTYFLPLLLLVLAHTDRSYLYSPRRLADSTA